MEAKSMEGNNSRWILAETDGYDITQDEFKTFEECQLEMEKRYRKLEPQNHEDSSKEMSFCGNTNAILYCNGENVYVWNIKEVHFN